MAANGSDDPVIDLERVRAQLGQFKLPSLGGGGFLLRLLLPVALLFVAYKVLVFFCLVYVGPNEYGIKVVRIPMLSARGVHEEVYDTGFHVVVRVFNAEEMYLFPKDVQVLDLTGSREEAAYEAAVTKAAHIQTSDGFFVDIDVSILYKIVQPHLVFTTLGPGRLFETNGIVPRAEPVLKQTLGELTTEEFYNSPARASKAALAKEYLNRELVKYGLAVDQVLVRYFRYTEEIQKNIEEKKLKDQLVFKNQAESRAAVEGAKLKKAITEGQANVDIKLQEGRAYVTTKEAERDLYVRTKRADADLQVKLADARKTQLRNDALQGAGSDRMVGLKMADVYKGLDVMVLPSDGSQGINPLDLQQALKLFEIRR